MPLKTGEIDHRLLDYNYKIEYPDGREVSADKPATEPKPFEGYKAGVSANATLLKTEAKLSEKWNASVETSGPSIGGSFGVKYGKETGVAAIVEPSLIKFDGKIGSLCGTVGLNGTTGLQVSEEGFKIGLIGFGVTYGIGKRYSIDTPLASGGFVTNENGVQQ